MKILFLRDNDILSDSRVLKEASSLDHAHQKVQIVGWDEQRRSDTVDIQADYADSHLPIHFLTVKLNYKFKYLKVLAYLHFEFQLFFYLLMNQKSYDVMHACNIHTGFIACLVKLLTKKKLVYDIFDFSPDTRNYPNSLYKLLVAMEFFVINRAEHVIICSNDRRTQIKGSNPRNLTVIYNSPDLSIKVNSLTTNFTLAYVGGLSPYRFLPELLDVVNDSSTLSLIIGGFGKYESLVSESAAQNKRIKFLGKVPYESVASIEEQADIMLALYDPQIKNHIFASPNKFFEAFRLGKPLIMVKGTGMSNWLEKLNVGVIIDPTMVSLKTGIKFLLNTRSNWDEQGELMRQIYAEEFAWPKMAQRLSAIYQHL